jgi:hypothetical protein
MKTLAQPALVAACFKSVFIRANPWSIAVFRVFPAKSACQAPDGSKNSQTPIKTRLFFIPRVGGFTLLVPLK